MTTLTGLVAAGVGMGFVTNGIAAVGRPGVAWRSARSNRSRRICRLPPPGYHRTFRRPPRVSSILSLNIPPKRGDVEAHRSVPSSKIFSCFAQIERIELPTPSRPGPDQGWHASSPTLIAEDEIQNVLT